MACPGGQASVELLAKRPVNTGEVERWTAGRKALALFPVRSARPSSSLCCCASVEDGRPRCHIHRRGRGQIPLGRPLRRPYPAGHSENPAETRAVPSAKNAIPTVLSRLLLAAIGSPARSCAISFCPDACASTENHFSPLWSFLLTRLYFGDLTTSRARYARPPARRQANTRR